MRIKIPHQLATLNDHDSANRTNKFLGAKLKQEQTHLVSLYARKHPKVDNPVFVEFEWHYSGKFDLDNIAFAKKYVLDGFVKAGVMKDDNQKCVVGFNDQFQKVAKGQEAVYVTLLEYEASD